MTSHKNTVNNGAFREDYQVTWDSTSLAVFDECPRKYYYRMILGITTKGNSIDIAFGQGYHKALETFDKTKNTLDERRIAALRAGLVTFHELGGYASSSPYKNSITLARTIIWYLETFGADDVYRTVEINGEPAVELSFEFPLTVLSGEDISLSGHLDRLTNSASGMFVLDRKTTKSSFSDFYWSQFANDIQMTMYTVAGRVCFAQPVNGVIIDAARVAVTFSEYMRHAAYRHSELLDVFVKEMTSLIEEGWRYADERYWPMRRSSCSKFGGCQYLTLCTKPESVRQLFIDNDYIQYRWDPTEKR